MRAFIILIVFSFLSSKILSSNIIFYRFPDNAAEKAMAPHSSTLAWKIPWMEEPGRLSSMGSHTVDTTESDLAAAAAINTDEKGHLRS